MSEVPAATMSEEDKEIRAAKERRVAARRAALLGALEPGAEVGASTEILMTSIATSLKRLADAAEATLAPKKK
jgi:hypothetical protein